MPSTTIRRAASAGNSSCLSLVHEVTAMTFARLLDSLERWCVVKKQVVGRVRPTNDLQHAALFQRVRVPSR